MVTKVLTYESAREGELKVIHSNGKHFLDLIQDVDGFWYLWLESKGSGGTIPGYILQELADKLDELNKPEEEIINKYFEEHPV